MRNAVVLGKYLKPRSAESTPLSPCFHRVGWAGHLEPDRQVKKKSIEIYGELAFGG